MSTGRRSVLGTSGTVPTGAAGGQELPLAGHCQLQHRCVGTFERAQPLRWQRRDKGAVAEEMEEVCEGGTL